MNKHLAALVVVVAFSSSASAQVVRIAPVLAGNAIGAAGAAAVPQSLSGFSGSALSAPSLALGRTLSAPAIDEAAAAPASATMEEHQRQLKALWAEERALGPEESARRHSEIYWTEQTLVQKIAVARGKREGATEIDLAQAKIAEMGLKASAHLVALVASLVASGTMSSDTVGLLASTEAAFEQLDALKASLPAGMNSDLRMRALEK